jgi:large conductance mechanosensitive channel
MSMTQEFKKFIMRGSVLDLAVGIIIGGAFGKIVSSFVNDVLMPPIGLLIGGIDFSNLALTLKAAQGEVPAVLLNYGTFINTIIDFLIIGFAIFIVVKAANRMQKKGEEKPAAPPAPPKEEVLLTEIRDILKAQR